MGVWEGMCIWVWVWVWVDWVGREVGWVPVGGWVGASRLVVGLVVGYVGGRYMHRPQIMIFMHVPSATAGTSGTDRT